MLTLAAILRVGIALLFFAIARCCLPRGKPKPQGEEQEGLLYANSEEGQTSYKPFSSSVRQSSSVCAPLCVVLTSLHLLVACVEKQEGQVSRSTSSSVSASSVLLPSAFRLRMSLVASAFRTHQQRSSL